MYYTKNHTLNKFEIFLTKEAYEQLPEEKKLDLSTTCRFIKEIKAWRSKAHIRNARYLTTRLTEWGVEYRGETGQQRTLAEKSEARIANAHFRLSIIDIQHARQLERREYHSNACMEIIYMFNEQPIHLEHHSQAYHQKLVKQADNHAHKSVVADQKASYYEEKYGTTLGALNAESNKHKDPVYLNNRIAACEKYLRKYQKKWQGDGQPLSEKDSAYWQRQIDREQKDLAFYQYCLEKCKENGVKTFDKKSLAGKTQVYIDGLWWIIVKLNPTTIAVRNTGYRDIEDQIACAIKYAYTRITDAA